MFCRKILKRKLNYGIIKLDDMRGMSYMHKIISFYNRNRKEIWWIIIMIAVFGSIWWFITHMQNAQEDYSTDNTSNIDTNDFNTLSMASQNEALSGKKSTTSHEKMDVLDKFFSYCNSGNIEEAYKLISDDCKEEMYQNIDAFKNAYYDPVFGTGEKQISVENYIDDIYIVTLVDDPLATGNVNQNRFQDHVTIVEDEEGNIKLNINNYIGRTKLNGKTSETNNIKVTAVYKDTYMDYEIYTFEVTNNSAKTIALGNTLKANFSQLVDENNIEYGAYVQELSQQDAVFYVHQTKNISIKYYSGYSTEKNVKKIQFPNIILDYETYDYFSRLKDTDLYSNYTSIEIEM